jgi:hypothetical protein
LPLGLRMPARCVRASVIALPFFRQCTHEVDCSRIAGCSRRKEEGCLHCRQRNMCLLPKNRVSHGACPPRAPPAAAARDAHAAGAIVRRRPRCLPQGKLLKSKDIACRCNAHT